jgi:hypothetical protein
MLRASDWERRCGFAGSERPARPADHRKVGRDQIGLHATNPFGLARQLGGGHHPAFIGKGHPQALQLEQDVSAQGIGSRLSGALAVRRLFPRIDCGHGKLP